MEITGTTKIGDIATLCPESISVFERYGVDFFHNSDRPLAEALSETGLSVGDILAEIERARESQDEEDRQHAEWSETAPANLADHIRETHHEYLSEHMPKLGELLSQALLSYGDGHDPLYDLAADFGRLRRRLAEHLDEEERLVFPLIKELASQDGHGPRSVPSDLPETLERLEQEHTEVLAALLAMRAHASECHGLEESASDCGPLFEALMGLEADLRRHIDLESEVLLPALRRLAHI